MNKRYQIRVFFFGSQNGRSFKGDPLLYFFSLPFPGFTGWKGKKTVPQYSF